MTAPFAFLPGCDGPRPRCETCGDRGQIYRDGVLVACTCRKPSLCATCKDTGVAWVWCCGPGLHLCVCPGTGGKVQEPCPEPTCTADPFADTPGLAEDA